MEFRVTELQEKGWRYYNGVVGFKAAMGAYRNGDITGYTGAIVSYRVWDDRV